MNSAEGLLNGDANFVRKENSAPPSKPPIINRRPETDLQKSDFLYELPERLIAQHPAGRRDGSRLLVIDRETGRLEHRHFYDIIEYLSPGDVLVVNDSKVIPARLYGHAEGREDAPLELLLLRERGSDIWETLVKPGKRARVGSRALFGGGRLSGEVTGMAEQGSRIIKFDYDRKKHRNIYELLCEIGQLPLPPYITERPAAGERGRYQTVYAKTEGSAAAPTAGLHFTPELLGRLEEKGVAVARVMLHVGLGTFRPVKERRLEEHIMHTEYFSVSDEAAALINERREAGGRIVCVGTTSCRTLESVSDEEGKIRPMSGDTGIFIYPGYKFRATDALITNFHLPESTLLMLVSAFWERGRVLEAYAAAVREEYRFFSFGDAMFIK